MYNLSHCQSLIWVFQISLFGSVKMKTCSAYVEVAFLRSYAVYQSRIGRKKSFHIYQSRLSRRKIFIKTRIAYPLLFPGQPAEINCPSAIGSSKAGPQPVNYWSISQYNIIRHISRSIN